jgi:DNA processing protein
MSRRRSPIALAVASLALALALGAWPASAATAELVPVQAAAAAGPGPCDVPVLGAVCAVPDALGGATDAISGIPGAIAGDVTESFARWIASGAARFLEQAGQAIFSGTEVNLFATGEGGRPWFLEHYARMAMVALAVFAPMLLLAVLHAVFSQSLSLLWRAVANLPVAALGTAAAVTIVGLLLGATDNISAFLAGGLGADTKNFLTGVVANLLKMSVGGNGLFGLALVSLFMVFAALVVWLELIVREAAIYLSVLFLPIGFATYIWPALSAWLRRLIEVIVALILSKLVIVAALALAGSALAAQEGFPALVAGAGMLLLAAFAPFALFKLIPIASMAAISSLEGQGRRGVRAAVPRASTAFYVRQLTSSHGRSGARAGGSSGAGRVGPTGGENPPPPIGGGGAPAGVGGGGAARLPVGGAGAGAAGAGSGSGAAAAAGPVAAGVAAARSTARAAKTGTTAQARKATDATLGATEGGEGQ